MDENGATEQVSSALNHAATAALDQQRQAREQAREQAKDEVQKRDLELVQRVQHGDQTAFEQLYYQYQGPVGRMVAHMVRDPEQVSDLLQEIFAKAYFALPKLDAETPFRPWLFRLASNHTIDYLRRQKRRPQVADPGPEQEWDLPDQSHPDALHRVLTRDLARKLLNSLKPRDRMLLVLQEFQELSLEEIGQIMGMRLPAVKVGLFRARKRLQEHYRDLPAKHVGRRSR